NPHFLVPVSNRAASLTIGAFVPSRPPFQTWAAKRIVHRCPQTFIGHVLDADGPKSAKSLKYLTLPRGLEPCFRRERALELLDRARRTRSSMTSTARLAKASFCGSRARSTTFVLGPCCGSKNG